MLNLHTMFCTFLLVCLTIDPPVVKPTDLVGIGSLYIDIAIVLACPCEFLNVNLKHIFPALPTTIFRKYHVPPVLDIAQHET